MAEVSLMSYSAHCQKGNSDWKGKHLDLYRHIHTYAFFPWSLSGGQDRKKQYKHKLCHHLYNLKLFPSPQ